MGQWFELRLTLARPLHLGFRRWGMIQQTRPYVTGRVFWGALTAVTTRCLHDDGPLQFNDFEAVGALVEQNLRSTCFFPMLGDVIRRPYHCEDGLRFGDLSLREFETKFISTMASTALDPSSHTAEEGALHEVEVLNAWHDDNGTPRRTTLAGLVWAHAGERNGWSLCLEDGTVSLSGPGGLRKTLCDLLPWAAFGGERTYGLGRVADAELLPAANCWDGLQMAETKEGSPVLHVPKDQPGPAPLEAEKRLPDVVGTLDRIVGREYCKENGSGRKTWRPSGNCAYFAPGWMPRNGELRCRLRPYGLLTMNGSAD